MTADRPGRLDLEGLFRPAAVTVVGASPDSFFAASLIEHLVRDEALRGAVHLVSRRRSEILGIPCVSSLDLVEDPGLVYLLVPAAHCLPVLRSAGAGVTGVVAISSGLSDEDEAGLREWAEERAVPLIGPNCMGLFAADTGFFGYAGPLGEVRRGRIGLVMQSGGMLSGIVGALRTRDLGIARAVSYGNAAAVDFPDLMSEMLRCDEVDAVLLYAESFRDVRALRRIGAEAADAGKRVVLVQGGQSDEGALAARSHTGALATPSRIVEGVATQAGLVVCGDLEEAVWSLEALMTANRDEVVDAPPGRGNAIAVMTSSGGAAIAIADAAARSGVRLVAPSAASAQVIATAIQAGPSEVANPIDVGAGIMDHPERITALVDGFAADPRYGVLVHVAGIGLPRSDLPRHSAVARQVVDAARSHGLTVVLSAIAGDEATEPWPGVAYSGSAREGMVKARALAAAPRRASRDAALSAGRPATRTESPPSGTRLVTGVEARRMLSSLEVRWPDSFDIGAGDAMGVAGAIEQRLGLPIVLKVEQVAHRASAGALLRGIQDRQAMATAIDYLRARFPGAPLSAHRTIDHDAEYIVGMLRSPQHGPLLSFGLGGTEVGREVSFASAPLADAEIEALVDRRAADIAPGAAQALRRLLAGVARLVVERPEIASLDLNPIGIVADDVFALDAKLEVAD